MQLMAATGKRAVSTLTSVSAVVQTEAMFTKGTLGENKLTKLIKPVPNVATAREPLSSWKRVSSC